MKATWDDFCGWLKEYMEVDIPISWERIEHPEGRIIRIDLFKDRPFHVTTAVLDERRLCTRDNAYILAMPLEAALTKALQANSPYTYIHYFRS